MRFSRSVRSVLAGSLLAALFVQPQGAATEEAPWAAPLRQRMTPAGALATHGAADLGEASSGGPSDISQVVEVQGDVVAARRAVEAAGGTVIGTGSTALHAEVPADRLKALAQQRGVDQVSLAPRLAPSVTSQGVASSGAAAWHTAGQTGAGVDVAVIDVGFDGWDTSPELQGTVIPQFGACSSITGTDHGTAVAEIVRDMAPGATLHLMCVDSTFDLDQPSDPVIEYLDQQDIEIANASIGSMVSSRGDGSGDIDRTVAWSRLRGTLWTASAGNLADGHTIVGANATRAMLVDELNGYYATALDLDPTGTTSRFLPIQVPANETVRVEMKWDAWPTTRQDFDLYVFDVARFDSNRVVASSTRNQAEGNLDPVEIIEISPTTSNRTLYLMVDAYDAGKLAIDLFVDSPVPLASNYRMPQGSIAEPATGPGALAVGAACVANPLTTVRSYSSQGPTIDGRVKPDLVGPDSVSTHRYGNGTTCGNGFLGTSAAAPHVAGAAALLKAANMDLDAGELQAILEARAQDAGTPGRDNQFGSGALRSGPVGTPQPPTPSRYGGRTPPVRVLATREAGTPLAPSTVRTFKIAGVHGVPADATAVVLNVTAVRSTSNGYLTVFPAGAARPFASNVNFSRGQVVPNSVTVGVGSDGSVSIFNSAGDTNVAVDLAGWYSPGATSALERLAQPVRAVDTRPEGSARIKPPGHEFGGSEVLQVQLAGNGALSEVPNSATAVVLNVTVTRPTVDSHLTVWPTGSPRPPVSSHNFSPGQTVANLVVATVGDGGAVNFATARGLTHMVVDVVGYFDASATGGFVATPTVFRITDSVKGNAVPPMPLGTKATAQLPGVSFYGVPRDAIAIMVNVTAVRSAAVSGNLRVWPAGQPVPGSSTVNFTKGSIVPNAALVGVGPVPDPLPVGPLPSTAGAFQIFNDASAGTGVVVDLSGYFVDV